VALCKILLSFRQKKGRKKNVYAGKEAFARARAAEMNGSTKHEDFREVFHVTVTMAPAKDGDLAVTNGGAAADANTGKDVVDFSAWPLEAAIDTIIKFRSEPAVVSANQGLFTMCAPFFPCARSAPFCPKFFGLLNANASARALGVCL
jgi:hypothetical protein